MKRNITLALALMLILSNGFAQKSALLSRCHIPPLAAHILQRQVEKSNTHTSAKTQSVQERLIGFSDYDGTSGSMTLFDTVYLGYTGSRVYLTEPIFLYGTRYISSYIDPNSGPGLLPYPLPYYNLGQYTYDTIREWQNIYSTSSSTYQLINFSDCQLSFDAQNRPVLMHNQNNLFELTGPAGAEKTTYYEYNAQGNFSKATAIFPNGDTFYIHKINYNAQNEMTGDSGYMYTAAKVRYLEARNLFTFDANGNITAQQMTNFDSMGVIVSDTNIALTYYPNNLLKTYSTATEVDSFGYQGNDPAYNLMIYYERNAYNLPLRPNTKITKSITTGGQVSSFTEWEWDYSGAKWGAVQHYDLNFDALGNPTLAYGVGGNVGDTTQIEQVHFYYQTINTNGIEGISADAGFSIYPNPAISSFTIHTDPSMAGAEIRITSMTGVNMYKGRTETGPQIISTQKFEKGVYLISVVSDHSITTQKLIIQ